MSKASSKQSAFTSMLNNFVLFFVNIVFLYVLCVVFFKYSNGVSYFVLTVLGILSLKYLCISLSKLSVTIKSYQEYKSISSER